MAKHLNRAPEILRCARHTGDWLRLALCYAGLRQSKFPLEVQLRDGLSFEFRDLADVATWWQIFYRNVYPVEPTDRVIIDAGANIGAFTLYALAGSLEAKVIAIEPFPSTFARLQAAVARSPYRGRVRLINAALSAAPGSVAMQAGEIGSQFRRVLSNDSAQPAVAVPSCTLPEILDSAGTEIDFLKMDIEGSEYASILSSPAETLRRIRRIAMEFHPLYTPDAPKPADLFEYFADAGFNATEIQDHGEGYGMAYLRRN